MSASSRTLGLALGAALLMGCGGFQIAPPVPSRPIVVGAFETVYAQELPADRRRMLDRLGVPAKMSLALRQAYPLGAGPNVRVMITQFRSGRWGPTRMHAVVFVMGANQQVLAQFEVDSTSMNGGSRNGLIRNVSQDCVNQIASQL